MPSTDTKPELTAKAQPVSQPAVYANGLNINCKNMSVVQTLYVSLQQDANIKITQDTQRQLLEKLKKLHMGD
jgi:hypothetical protein